MTSFFAFYTTFCVLVGVTSCVSLGFIQSKYHTVTNSTCDARIKTYGYNLYHLNLFLLSTLILSCLIQFIMYIYTRNLQSSTYRKITIFIMTIIYIAQWFGSIPMIIEFKNNTACLNFYKNTDHGVMVITFFGLCCVFILEATCSVIALCASMFCTTRVNYYGLY